MQAELAGVIPRAAAYLIDILIRFAILLFLGIILRVLGEFGVGLLLLAWFLVEWFYPVLFEMLARGQTPGKKKMGLIVFNDDLTPVTWLTSILRNLLRAADFLPLGYAFGVAAMLLGRHFQRLGDMVAGTVVVHSHNASTTVDPPDVFPRVPDIPLLPEGQRAVIRYTQQHGNMTPERAEELGNILSPITGKTGRENVQHLYGIGNWLLGVKGRSGKSP